MVRKPEQGTGTEAGNFQDAPRNRRNHARINLTGETVVKLEAQDQSVDGHVVDISLGGARLRPSAPLNTSLRFISMIFDGLATIAEIVWRRGEEIGLRFTACHDQMARAAGLFERVIMREFRGQKPDASLA